MRISAKADYAVRAALELAASPDRAPVKGTKLAEAQEIPLQFLEQILLDLKRAGLVRTKRGARGGYWLARDPETITVADVIRAVEGPLANIHDLAAGGDPLRRPCRNASATSGSRSASEPSRRARAGRRSRSSPPASCPTPSPTLVDEPGAWFVRETGTHDVVG